MPRFIGDKVFGACRDCGACVVHDGAQCQKCWIEAHPWEPTKQSISMWWLVVSFALGGAVLLVVSLWPR